MGLGFLFVALYATGVLRMLRHVFRIYQDWGDSWGPMRVAWEWFRAPHTTTMYQEIFFTRQIKFQYPPSSLLIFGLGDALHRPPTNMGLSLIGDLFLLLQIATVALLYLSCKGWSSQSSSDKIRLAGVSLWIALGSMLCLGIVSGMFLGQVQMWLNCWFVLASLCWIHNRRLLTGILIGAICIFKPQFGLFFIWAALRKEKKFILGWAAVVVPAELISLATFGLANNLDYLNILRYMSHRGETGYANQCFNGLANRLMGNGDTLVFNEHGFPPYNLTVYAITIVTSALLIAGALLYRRRAKEANVIDLLIAGVSFTAASPIAWEHHYGFLPAVLVILAMTISKLPSKQRRVKLGRILAVAWFFSAITMWPYWLPQSGFGSLIISSFFYGVLGLLALLYYLRDDAFRLRSQLAGPPEAATSPALPR